MAMPAVLFNAKNSKNKKHAVHSCTRRVRYKVKWVAKSTRIFYCPAKKTGDLKSDGAAQSDAYAFAFAAANFF